MRLSIGHEDRELQPEHQKTARPHNAGSPVNQVANTAHYR
jgi:hypothetical protein